MFFARHGSKDLLNGVTDGVIVSLLINGKKTTTMPTRDLNRTIAACPFLSFKTLKAMFKEYNNRLLKLGHEK